MDKFKLTLFIISALLSDGVDLEVRIVKAKWTHKAMCQAVGGKLIGKHIRPEWIVIDYKCVKAWTLIDKLLYKTD